MTEAGGPAPAIAGLEFLSLLGSGGYSDVYLYEQQMPRRKVAVKVLRNERLTDKIRRQFTAEANAMAELADHPSIVPVFSADIADDGRPYLVMMYYPRPDLGMRAAEKPFAVSELLRVGIQIASAVETAHRAGILHRDIKPANILTSQYGAVGLTDFGIAVNSSAVDDDEDGGMSVPWAPPEILYDTAPASVQSDLYSLGATLWHLLVGRPPFQVVGGDNTQFALMHRARDTPVPPTGRADVPPTLERLLAQAMAKNPAVRPQTALDLARSLQTVEQEQRLPRTEIVVLADQPAAPSTNPVPIDPSIPEPDATRLRGPVRIDAQPTPSPPSKATKPAAATRSPGASAPGAGETIRRPILVPSNGASPTTYADASTPLAKQAPAETIRRSTPTPPPSIAEEPVREEEPFRGRTRVLIAVAVVVAVVIAGVVALTARHPKDQLAAATSTTVQTVPVQDNIGPPGPVTVTAKRVNPSVTQFTVSYSNRAESDTLEWETSGCFAQADATTSTALCKTGTSKATTFRLTGKALECIEVRVRRVDGIGTVAWTGKTTCPST